MLRGDGLRHSGRPTRRQLRPPGHPHGGNAPGDQDHAAMRREADVGGRPGPRHRRQRQSRAALAARNEAFDGSAHPSFQTLYRRLSCSGGRGLLRRRSAERRVWRLSRLRWHQQALSLQDPRARLRASAGDGFPLPQAHARRRQRNPRLDRHRLRGGGPMSVRRLAEVQPESFAFTPENEARCAREIAKYPEGRQASAVIALLWLAQQQNGHWLTKPAIEKVAAMLGMPDIRVLEIATFYSMFNLAPVGKYFIQFCGTTPCVLAGADAIKSVLMARVGPAGQVTADGLFSWCEVECLGACCNAPMVQINDDYYEDLTPEGFGSLLDDLAIGRPVKTGSQIGRVSSEPVGGLTSLTTLYGAEAPGGLSAPANDHPPTGKIGN